MTGPDISSQRADPFAIDAEPDLSGFKPRPAQRTPAVARATIRQVSEENNFPSREAATKNWKEFREDGFEGGVRFHRNCGVNVSRR